jgi:hypothetical protein
MDNLKSLPRFLTRGDQTGLEGAGARQMHTMSAVSPSRELLELLVCFLRSFWLRTAEMCVAMGMCHPMYAAPLPGRRWPLLLRRFSKLASAAVPTQPRRLVPAWLPPLWPQWQCHLDLSAFSSCTWNGMARPCSLPPSPITSSPLLPLPLAFSAHECACM